jgi:predicted transcriptional regulator
VVENPKNYIAMQKLTNKEEELMLYFWERGAMFVKDIVALYDDPKPHFNTISTMVRTLEAKGFLDHEAFGNTYRYRPIISQEEFSKGVLGSVVTRYFENSYKSVVSALIDEEKISIEELEELIRKVNNQ